MLARCSAGFDIEDEVFASELRRDDQHISSSESILWAMHQRATMDRARRHSEMCLDCARADTPVERHTRQRYQAMRKRYHHLLLGSRHDPSGQLATVSCDSAPVGLKLQALLYQLQTLRGILLVH